MEVNAGIDLDADACEVLHIVLQSQVPIGRLQVIRQAVVTAAEIIAFIFDTGAKVPFAGDQKAVVVREIIVQRIAVA